MMRKRLFFILRLSVSLSAILLLLWLMRSHLSDVLQTIKKADIHMLFFCFLLSLGVLVGTAWRLKIILSTQQANISLKEAVCLTFIGIFFNNFMPTSVGGDVIKAYYTSKKTAQKMVSFTSVFVDRVIGLISLIFIATIVVILWGKEINNPPLTRSLLIMVILSAIFILFLANKNIARSFSFILIPLKRFGLDEKIRHTYQAINSYSYHRAVMIYSIFISLTIQLLSISIIYFLAQALYVTIPFKTALLAGPVIAVASMLPSINGLGVREGAYVFLLKKAMGGEEKAFALSLLFLGLLIANSLIGGLIFLIEEQFKIAEIRQDIITSQQQNPPEIFS